MARSFTIRSLFLGAALAAVLASQAFAQDQRTGGSPVTGPPAPTQITATGAGTYTTPTDAYGNAPKYLDVYLYGPGGPGAGGGTTPGNGTVSTSDTTFGSFTAGHGAAASGLTGGAVGTCSGTGIISTPVQAGTGGANGFTFAAGGVGGGGGFPFQGSSTPPAPPANSGFGGPGGSAQANASPGGGGGQGAVCRVIIFNPASSYSDNVGPASTGGATGTGGTAAAGGAAGRIVVVPFFQ